MSTDERERAEFDKWAAEWLKDIAPELVKPYKDHAWPGWQARAQRATPTPAQAPAQPIPQGWKIKRDDTPPFKCIEIHAPNGYGARVMSHERNPSNVLYLLAEALLAAAPPQAAAQAVTPADYIVGGQHGSERGERQAEGPGEEARGSDADVPVRQGLPGQRRVEQPQAGVPDVEGAPGVAAQAPAAQAVEALHAIIRAADAAKEPCGMDPESPAAIRNGKFASIAQMAAQGLGLVRGPSLAAPAQAAQPVDPWFLGTVHPRCTKQCQEAIKCPDGTGCVMLQAAHSAPVAWRVPNKGREGWLFAEKRQMLAFMDDVPEPLYARPESQEPVARMHVGGLEPFGHAAVIEKLPAADAMPHGDYSLYAAPDHHATQTPRPNEPELGAT